MKTNKPSPIQLALVCVLALGVPFTARASGVSRAGERKQQLTPQAPAANAGASLSDEEVRGQINAYLGSIDTPIGPEQWQGLGPRAAPMLEEIARNGEQFPTRRSRAVDGIAAIKWERGAQVLRDLARDEGAPPVVRFSSVRGLAYLLPKSQVTKELTPLLEGAKDSRVRAVAAEELVRKGSGSCPLVQRQLGRELEEIRGQFVRAIDACAEALHKVAK